ncbi:deoxyribodipyrimidine photo-lyase [Methylocystis sp. B8]|uniref:cryptochrome/photolyase family protein n=1 Tax=Methylocystis sp. B8 TaxID=544938 RepID=UPI0010FE5E1D|nr:deoxyribodipyrimidine photo-lyase [Methylocystis sp. B8]TLG75109.1 deoxyribodipyrimidine photo-lyase [Methylocystis sp. B8]
MNAPAIVWFRNDLRVADNPALTAAARTDAPLVALYVLDDESPGEWSPGAAARWWLHHSLAALAESLAERGVQLTLRRGRAQYVFEQIVAEIGAGAVFWNKLYEPWAIRRDEEITAQLHDDGVETHCFHESLLFEPETLRTKQGESFRAFTPFWRACLAAPPPEAPLPAPTGLHAAPLPPHSDDLDAWRLLPQNPDWAVGMRKAWLVGETAARAEFADFARHHVVDYKAERDFMGRVGVSRLSPHLHFGELSPREVWRAISEPASIGGEAYLRELGWREFCHHLLIAHHDLPERPLDRTFERFPYRDDERALDAWRNGQTGYPLVDAAMRELWITGWMHNRARLVSASFLIKHLLIDWRKGERWFWDTLVDADLANNSANWQWVAGCGADAAPYFRIFNPALQGEKFDPDGAYVRRYVPELAELDAHYIHRPWTAPEDVLRAAGVRLGDTYPHPIVDHAEARDRALAAFEWMRGQASLREA